MIKLNDFNHFRDDNRVKFKTEVVDGKTFTIISYTIADSTLWQKPLALEVRGSVFDEDGNCVSRPLHKFFNINETPDTQLNKLKMYNSTFLEKRDGSMVVPILINDKIYWKTKKSFYSGVALRANETAPENVLKVSRSLLETGYTPIFEFTHPEHQIVIDYGSEPKFVLIAIRNVDTGEYVSALNQELLCYANNINVIRRYGDNSYQMINELDIEVDFEGYVIRHSDGIWTKAKSKWYLSLHHTMTDLRERDVALDVINETVDDLKSLLVTQGKDISPIELIEHSVNEDMSDIISNTESLLMDIKKEASRKDAAMKYHRHEFFKLAMILFDNKEPNYKDHWKNNIWKSKYTLKVVYNKSFSNIES